MNEAEKQLKIEIAEEKARKKALRPWYAKKRFIIPGALIALGILSNAMNGGSTSSDVANTSSESVTQESATSEETESAAEYPNETTGQTNAREQAESYLKFQVFSKLGLVDQLLFEDYSQEDSEYAVDVLKVDWKEQALLKAESYLSNMAFSAKGLYDQLIFEKFTEEEADFGVANVEVDWMEQAALKAKSYLSSQSFSRQGLIDQLLFEGFTEEQAVYGVEQNGY